MISISLYFATLSPHLPHSPHKRLRASDLLHSGFGSRIPIVCVSGTALEERNAFADATLDKDPVEFIRTLGEVLSKHAKMQPKVPVPQNEGEVSSAQKAPRSNAGFDRHEGETQDHHRTWSLLDRTKERGSSY